MDLLIKAAITTVVVFPLVAFVVEFIRCGSRMGGQDANMAEVARCAAGNLVDEFYRRPVLLFREWRCKRARKYLLKYDYNFRLKEASLELVRRRNEFYRKGGSAASPNCPELEEVLKDFG